MASLNVGLNKSFSAYNIMYVRTLIINLLLFARKDLSLRHRPLLGRNLKPINYG